ncbi:MAG: cytochrome c-type biogenesis protein [Dongiaceae bacterium]
MAMLWLALAPALAQEAQLADPKLEQRARDLSREIRCVVCQSQSVADSDADIAKELRAMIREQIAAGKSDQDIRDYLVARYGDFVLFDPPFKASTYVLWIGPFAVLVLAGIGVALFFRRRAQEPVGANPLSADEQSRVARLLHDGAGDAGAKEGGS